jgi:hypothetical protein
MLPDPALEELLPDNADWLDRAFREFSDDPSVDPDSLPLALIASTDSFFWPAEEELSPDIEMAEALSEHSQTPPTPAPESAPLPVTASDEEARPLNDSVPTLYNAYDTSDLPELLGQTFTDMERVAVPVNGDTLFVVDTKSGQDAPDIAPASVPELPDAEERGELLKSADLEPDTATPPLWDGLPELLLTDDPFPDSADLTLPEGEESVAQATPQSGLIVEGPADSSTFRELPVSTPTPPELLPADDPFPDSADLTFSDSDSVDLTLPDSADLTLPEDQQGVAQVTPAAGPVGDSPSDSSTFIEGLDNTLQESISDQLTIVDRVPDFPDAEFFQASTLSDSPLAAEPAFDQFLDDLPTMAEARLPDLDLALELTEEAGRSELPTPTEPMRHQPPTAATGSGLHAIPDDQPAESEADTPPPTAAPDSGLHAIPDDQPAESEADALRWLDMWVESLDDTPKTNITPEPFTPIVPRPDDKLIPPVTLGDRSHSEEAVPESSLSDPDAADHGIPDARLPEEEAGDGDQDWSLSGDNLEDALAWLESRDPAGSTFYEWQEPETLLADSRPGTIITGLYAKERRYAFAAFNAGDHDTFIAVCRNLLQSSPTAAVIVESDLRALAERLPPLPEFSCLLGDACAAQESWEQAAGQYRLAVEQARNDTSGFEAFLPLLDHLEEAGEQADVAALREMVPALLQKLGIQLIPAVGQRHDPQLHLVVARCTVPDVAADTVLTVRRAGYLRNNQVIRRAEVEISD